ncbi:MAG TPA: hypothetical protein PLU88_13905 [Armatimonadota bacterium]|nr:hypothetical protein [Armatimonadota bacterium]HOP80920.1 hypothetical protein [Armatimonadota bacterium]HPP76212.1 hypothetical protein [Armatimonadota bacterium]
MRDALRVMDEEAKVLTGRTDVDEFPMPVAEDWDEQVEKANKVAEVIDKHLDFEEGFQGIEMRPLRLCPEQRVSLVTDLSVVTK